MASSQEFLKEFTFGGLIATASVLRPKIYPTFLSTDDLSTLIIDPSKDLYFGPAMRRTEGNEKKDVLGTKVLWVDVDHVEKPQCTLPPSMTVFSGHGWHLYWILKAPLLDVDLLESLNKILVDDIPTSDNSCWNCNRVLRVPGTTNLKQTEAPVPVELKVFKSYLTYTPEDIQILTKLNKATKHKISTGDSRGYRSRSERDWAILTALVNANASEALIALLFFEQPCGDKAKDNDQYLKHTLEEIKAKEPTVPVEEFVEKEDGYYAPFRKGLRRVSTFTISPKVLLDGSVFNSPDAIVGDVNASKYVWKNITFTRAAFSSVGQMDKQTPIAAWQWLGHDDDVRKLLPFLLDTLQAQGLPKVAATPVLGLHKIKNKWLFLGHSQTTSAEEVWDGHKGPLAWLPLQREHPEMNLEPLLSLEQLDYVGRMVPQLNHPETIWPMIGWYAATVLKPWIEERKYRFPILNVAGTKGSGKTTLIQRVFMPLFGQSNPKTYDANTTRFVTLILMGSTNAIPIAFSEFRYESVDTFIRFILLSYDTGHDPRGRGDQTTVDYALTAPFSVDGEDLIEDPAARERVVVAQLHPEAVLEGSTAYAAFKEFRDNVPENFGGYYIKEVLKLEPEWKDILERAKKSVFDEFPSRLPDRVRNNHIVAYFGILLWCKVTNTEIPSPSVLKGSITSVFDLTAGRARTLVDSMVEDVANAVASGTVMFASAYNAETNILWFQLAPTHSWWIASRRRQGRGSLERDAIRAQLKEAPYSVVSQVVNGAWMFGVDLAKASELGLDVPIKISDRAFVVRF